MNALLDLYSHVVPGGRLSRVMIFSLSACQYMRSTQCDGPYHSPQLTRFDRLALFLDPYAQHVFSDPMTDDTSDHTIVLFELVAYHPEQQTLEQKRRDWVQ